MKFEPLAELLQDNISKLKMGKTLFINQMPVEVIDGVLLKDSFSGTSIDGYIDGMRRGRFSVAVRGKNYSKTKELAEQVQDILSISGVTLPGMEVKQIRALNEPVPYMNSVGNLVEFSMNFSAIYGIVAE